MNRIVSRVAVSALAVSLIVLDLGQASETRAVQVSAQGNTGGKRATRDGAWFLRRMVDVEWLAYHEPGVRCRQFSSYDRRSKIVDGKKVDWRANGDAGNYIRITPEEGNVMAEMEGPGCITQFWSANPGGTIKFWLDGEKEPSIVMPMTEMLHDRGHSPFKAPFSYQVRPGATHTASNCYFPIPYAKSCKIAVVGAKMYYNIDYITYPKGTPVQTFRLPLTSKQRAAVTEVAAKIANRMSSSALVQAPANVSAVIAPGKEAKVAELGNTGEAPSVGGILRQLAIKADSSDKYRLRKAVLKIYYDNRDRPGVVAPLGDFFGTGWFATPYQSMLSRIEKDGTMVCNWPMPFKKHICVSVTNLSNTPLTIRAAIQGGPARRDCECKPMYFHAMYRREKLGTTFDYPFCKDIVGPGRGVGNLLNIDNPKVGWWGEGDEKVWVDDDEFPSWYGTGSEDYYNDAWGMHLHSKPYEGCSLLEGPGHSNKTSMYRWHVLDSIPFEKRFTMTIENYHDSYGRVPSDYSSVAYYYNMQPQGAAFYKPLTLADLLPCNFRPAGTIEAETLAVAARAKRTMSELAKPGVDLADQASGSGAVALAGAGQQGSPTDIPLGKLKPGVYRLSAYLLAKQPTGGPAVVWRTQPGATLSANKLPKEIKAGSSCVTIGMLFVDGDRAVSPVIAMKAGQDTPVYLDAIRVETPPTHGIEAESVKWTSPDHLATVKREVGNTSLSGWGRVCVDTITVGGLVAMPVDLKPGFYAVSARVACGPDFGKLRVRRDRGASVLSTYDGYAAKPGLRTHGFGRFEVAKGKTLRSLEFMLCGKNAKSTGTKAAVDYVEIVRCKNLMGYEGEDMPVIKLKHGNVSAQTLNGKFSRKTQKFITFQQVKGRISLGFDVALAGKYEVVMAFCKSHDYATFDTYLNGKKIGPRLDNYNPTVIHGGPIKFGVVEFKAGPQVLEFRVVGKNKKSSGYYMGFDCLDLMPAR